MVWAIRTGKDFSEIFQSHGSCERSDDRTRSFRVFQASFGSLGLDPASTNRNDRDRKRSEVKGKLIDGHEDISNLQ